MCNGCLVNNDISYNMIENNEKYGPIEEYKWQYISKKLNDILKG